MNLWNKLKKNDVQVAIVMLGILIIALLPLLYLGKYAHPCADDFSYGYYPHLFWTSTHSLYETLQWNIYQVKSTYYSWQGTFSSAFLMGLSPAVWGEQYYFLTPIIMLTITVFSHFYILYMIIVRYLKASKSVWCSVSSVTVFLMIETMFTPNEGLYWFNGAVHYVFMHGGMILLFSLILHSNIARSKWGMIFLTFLACLWSVICGGSNYSTALLGLLGVLFLGLCILINNRQRIQCLFPIATYTFAFYKNISAPGNAMRQTNFETQSPFEAVWNSVLYFFNSASNWITLPVLLFLLILVPCFWQLAKGKTYRFRRPLLVTILSIGAVACMFTPSFYAMGISGPGRLINIVKMWFLFLLVLNEGYWIGYLHLKLADKLPSTRLDIRIYISAMLLLILFSFILRADQRLFDYSSYAAYVSIRAGEAETYHQEYLTRLEILENSEEHVYLYPFSVKPRLLFFDDITTATYDWRNSAMAQWYNKGSVTLYDMEP